MIGLNGRVDDGILPLPGRGGAINFASGEEVTVEMLEAAAAEQAPNTLIFLHT